MEFFRHLFGLCGEAHPSAIYYLGLPTVVIGFRGVIKNFILGLRLTQGSPSGGYGPRVHNANGRCRLSF